MLRVTGTYRQQTVGGETVRAFIPHPLPPAQPPLVIEGELFEKHVAATIAVERLSVAAVTVPSLTWFLYGFVRKEAVISSQIEGTQATLEDVMQFEATQASDRPDDVEVTGTGWRSTPRPPYRRFACSTCYPNIRS